LRDGVAEERRGRDILHTLTTSPPRPSTSPSPSRKPHCLHCVCRPNHLCHPVRLPTRRFRNCRRRLYRLPPTMNALLARLKAVLIL
jgi:hypothetical protein